MIQCQTLISTAAGQIGAAESPRGSNNILFNTAYYGREVSGSAYPWCMVFVWWCFRQAGLSHLFYDGGRTASCTALMRWAKARGRWIKDGYQAGDVILFQFDADAYADHVGILERLDNGKLVCIEGNTNDEVRRVVRDPSVVMGAWRPLWEDEEPEEPSAGALVTVTLAVPALRKGDGMGERDALRECVMTLQRLLVMHGFSCGRYGPKKDGVDGEFGDDTQFALLRFQKANGLNVSGICEEQTWKKLLGVTA